jgi:transcriptional regulator with XRE-family HTH domain
MTRLDRAAVLLITSEQVKALFAPHLKAARKAAGYGSAAAFARAVGIEAATYRHWERGQALPDLSTLAEVLYPALGFGLNELVDELAGRAPKPEPTPGWFAETDVGGGP